MADDQQTPADDPNDVFTKRTRPLIARQSWYVTMAYGVATVGTGLLQKWLTPIMFSWEVYLAMATPALFYMGLREVSKWKHGPSV